MFGHPQFQTGFTELDDLSASAYGHAVQLGCFDRAAIISVLKLDEPEVDRIEQVLLRMRLLQPRPGDPSVLVPVSPDVAAADLVGPTEHQIRDLMQAVTDVRGKLLSLTPLYFEGRRLRNRFEAFDVITDVDAIQNVLNRLGQTCRKEVLTVQPGGARPSSLLPAARKSAEGMLERGVRMHTIYQHTARGDLATKAYVRDVTALGAEIRTADEVIDRMLIYDRETVFLPVRTCEGGESAGAAIVREPTLVAFLCAVFQHLWDSATPFACDTPKATPATDELKQSILRLMAQGYKDEMVARRLGMSVRTCRRHISEITEELEATSRFQAGYNVAMAGLLGKGPAASAAEWQQPSPPRP
ncbi:helix-turn-helix transcriptional regulator [Streptomyces sp. FH025]|uniref:helix-turn-helix domain-containing protein n=1 Tax=Streptomyces sp. FH025 TaxID=2815937 RepID=UPI001A9D0CEA|nr:helix-turn-helix transcriptional regulator [Streptomyces sp. FH025]MBO1415278.1 helix-turn-helix transcriptional regulator [Streptomyces sp. FH025]